MKTNFKTKSLTILSIFALALIPLSGCGAGDTNEPSVITSVETEGSANNAPGDVVVTGKAGSNLDDGQGDEKGDGVTTEWETSTIDMVTPQDFKIDVTSVPANGYDAKIQSNLPGVDVNQGKAVAMAFYLSLSEAEQLKYGRGENAKPDSNLVEDPAFGSMLAPGYKTELAKQLDAGTAIPMSDREGTYMASQGEELEVAENGWVTEYNPDVRATFERSKELGTTIKYHGDRKDTVNAVDGSVSVDTYSFSINLAPTPEGGWEVVQSKTTWEYGSIAPGK